MQIYVKIIKGYLLFCTFLNIIFVSCKKLVDVNPPANRIASANVYNSDATAIAVLNGIYSKISSASYSSGGIATIRTISLWVGLSSDEFTLWNGSVFNKDKAYYRNALSPDITGTDFWNDIYSLIYSCNAAIEGLNQSNSLTPIVKLQLVGEAKFMRAFFYFYLVNLYGDVPLVLSTDYTINSSLSKSPILQIYQQMIVDLLDAKEKLADGYVKGDAMTLYPTSSIERIRPNKAAAAALLARVYLYVGDWSNAEIEASSVIRNTATYDIVPLSNVFLKNSKEAIWQLQPVTSGSITNTAEAYTFVLTRSPSGVNNDHPVYLSSSLFNNIENGDNRFVNGNWVKIYSDASGVYYYPYKFKDIASGTAVTPTEYAMVLRLAEQYLIRAEARAMQNNLQGAIEDVNLIRLKHGGLATQLPIPVSQLASIEIILHERQVELFTEWGHRWFDLKRTKKIDAVLSLVTPLKAGGNSWQPYQQLYPIPTGDLLRNINLVQNSGY